MRRQALCLTLLVAGCATLAPAIKQERELLVYPRLNSRTQSVVQPNTLSTIATLDIIPYLETTPGSYAPVSSLTGNTTTVGAADMLKLSQASPSIDPDRPFILRKLKANRNYRIYGRAYNTANAQISLDASSFTDVAVGQNDAPGMATLPVNLTNTPFGASSKVLIGTEGRYDYLKGTLYLVSGNTQVALAQTTRYNPEFAFSNLQANSNYRLVAEAYKLGAVTASNSLNITIGNDDVPASLSMSLSIPYVATTLAGSGSTGFVDGVGTAAGFNTVVGSSIDAQGNLFIADYYNTAIRKVTPSGVVTTVVNIGNPYDVAVDSQGNLYVPQDVSHYIRKITPEGVVSILAGSGNATYADGNGTAAAFKSPSGVTVDSQGNVYVADRRNHRIRKVTSAGVVTTVAGNGTAALVDGPALQASFNEPIGIAIDASDNLYVADWANNAIRKISGGTVTTIAGNGSASFQDGTGTAALFAQPLSLTLDPQGNIFVSDWGNHRIRKITPAKVVTTLAGSGSATYVNGTGLSATFHYPWGIEMDAMGNLYVADEHNDCVRKLQ